MRSLPAWLVREAEGSEAPESALGIQSMSRNEPGTWHYGIKRLGVGSGGRKVGPGWGSKEM